YLIRAEHVIEVLEKLRVERGLPEIVITDNGSEFTSRAFDAWAYTRGVVENHAILLLWRHPVLRTRLLPNSGNSAPSVTTSRTEGTGGQTGKGADHGRSGHGAQRHLGPAGRPADGRERGRAPLPPEEARGRARARRPRASADGHGRLRGRDPGDPRGRRGRASDRRGPADAGPPSL